MRPAAGVRRGARRLAAPAPEEEHGVEARAEVGVYACGPHPMLAAVVDLARRHGLPCHVSLEEYMACGVGGCAGCAVQIETAAGPAMKRVCVDGPVFDGYQAFPAAN